MKAYIHIGMDKTGTTYLQLFCYDHRSELESHGLHYPLGVGGNLFSHVNFAHAHGFGWHDEATDSSSELAGTHLQGFNASIPLLLSSEAFALDTKIGPIKRLKRWLDLNGYDDVKIIVFLRNQIDFFVGIYSEAIKWGNKFTTAPFYDLCRSRMFYAYMLNLWAEVFGQSNIIAHNYDESRSALGVKFFDSIGHGGELNFLLENYVAAFPNISPPQLLLEYIRAIELPIDRSELYDFIARRLNVKRVKHLRSLSKVKIWSIPERLIADVSALDAENTRLCEQYGFVPFHSLETRINEYSADVISSTVEQNVALATLLLTDMQP